MAGDLAGSGRHLREALETGLKIGLSAQLVPRLDLLAHLCAARGQRAEAVTLGAAFQAQLDAEGTLDLPLHAQRRQEALRRATRALGPDRTRAAQECGAAMSMAAVTEFALQLTDAPAPSPVATGLTQLSSANRSWSPWSPTAAPTRRSPPSCSSASARSPPTWTASATRRAAAAAST